MYKKISQEMTDFLKGCLTAFHAVANIAAQLEENGYQRLRENEAWEIKPGGNYYVTRNDSSIIAFQIGTQLRITALISRRLTAIFQRLRLRNMRSWRLRKNISS